MVFEFKFPDVGEGITEGKLVEWTIKQGDNIKVDQSIAKVETDKAVVDIPSPISGTVKELLFEPGDTLEVGKVIMHIDEKGSTSQDSSEVSNDENKTDISDNDKEENDVSTNEKPQTPSIPEPPKHEEVEAPQTPKEQSDEVEKENPEISKGILALPKVRKVAREKNIDLTSITPTGKNGEITMEDLGEGKQLEKEQTPQEKTIEKEEPSKSSSEEKKVYVANKDILATPSVKKKARELGIDINSISGSGENGKILLEDLNSSQPQAQDTPTKSTESIETSKEDKVIPIEGIRSIVAKRMSESLQKTAQVTIFDEVDMTELVEFRNRHKDALKERGIKLSFIPFFVKGVVYASKKFPNFNSIIDENNNSYIQKAKHNIGIAVDTSQGLFVPVMNNCDNKNILEMAQEISALASKARDQKLSPKEMQGGTFTISSLGLLGGTFFTPIINYPQVAILGIGKIEEKPVIRNGEIKIRNIGYFSLTFDHRIVDGAEAARFLKEIKEHLEDPELLLMEMR